MSASLHKGRSMQIRIRRLRATANVYDQLDMREAAELLRRRAKTLYRYLQLNSRLVENTRAA